MNADLVNLSIDFLATIDFLVFFIALFLSLFLFWRAGRHELHDSTFLLDFGFFSVLGGLIFGRFIAFLINFKDFNFSFYRLIFFHIYPGFSFWGFLTGILIFAFLFLRSRKENYWEILDFAVAPITFGQMIFYLFDFSIVYFSFHKFNFVSLILAIFYLLLFVVMKRLATKKRYKGFFVNFYFVLIGFFNSVVLVSSLKFEIFKLENIVKFILPLLFFAFGLIFWYFLSKRKLKNDLKALFAFLLLNIFKFKRAITSADEAGRIAKSLIFLPYFIFSSILISFKMLFKEAVKAFRDFIYVLGMRKF